MPVLGNLVHETTTTTGTGPLALAREAGRQRIIEMLNRHGLGVGDNGGNNPILFISNRDANEWAVVQGYLSDEDSPDGGTLVIVTTIEGSGDDNSPNTVSWSAGTKDITNAIDAATLSASDDYGLVDGAVTLSDDYGSIA